MLQIACFEGLEIFVEDYLYHFAISFMFMRPTDSSLIHMSIQDYYLIVY